MSKDDLVALREELENARLLYNGAAAANTTGLNAAELVAVDLAYRRAERKYQDAIARYEMAMKKAVES